VQSNQVPLILRPLSTKPGQIHEAVDATRAVDCHIRNSLEPILRSKLAIMQIRVRMVRRSAILQTEFAKPRERQMVKNALLCFALASTGVIGAALELGVNYALAADDCITESNLVPPKGTRWDYRIDRAGNRKCWFLMKVTIAPVAPQTRRPLPRSTLARISPKHRSVRNLSESEQAKVTTAPVALQTRRPLPRSTLARVSPEHRSMRNLSESEQAALFLEFLRWKEQQSAVNSNAAAESLRGTISP
jgi:hypothetical protein